MQADYGCERLVYSPCRWQKSHPVRKHWASESSPGILCRMIRWLTVALRLALAGLKSHRNLLLENLALRHQLLVLSRGSNRPRLTPMDRALWAWLSHTWEGWKTRLYLVKPGTVIHLHRESFRIFWKWKSRHLKDGRKTIAPTTYTLIRHMNLSHPLMATP